LNRLLFDNEITTTVLKKHIYAIIILAICISIANAYFVNSFILEQNMPQYRMAKWLNQNTKKGELVANLNYNDFAKLYFLSPHLKYLHGMDPVFLYARSPDIGGLLYSFKPSITKYDVDKRINSFKNIMKEYNIEKILFLDGYANTYTDNKVMIQYFKNRDDTLILYQGNDGFVCKFIYKI